MKNSCKQCADSFTIVELLVAIAIIAILVSAVIPSYHRFREYAAMSAVKSTAKNIELAIRAYEAEYKEWPVNSQGPHKTEGAVVDILAGQNPKGIPFFEPGNTNAILTPRNVPFEFCVDYNYNNRVGNTPDGELFRPVAVWTDFTNSRGEIITIKSWE